MPSYPLPTAHEPEVNRVIALYREKYNVQLSYDDAKRFLEGVMQFIYLTEIEDAVHGLRDED